MIAKPRNWLSALLAVLLVFCQQVGFAHALTHLNNPTAPRPTRSDTQHPAEKACTGCVMFAQLGAALTGSALHVGVASAEYEQVAITVRVFDPAFIPAYHSRAPPLPIE